MIRIAQKGEGGDAYPADVTGAPAGKKNRERHKPSESKNQEQKCAKMNAITESSEMKQRKRKGKYE